ncbi:trehalose-6-phosphate synthase [Sinorhizobium sp. 7-81]|uniref:alpha,alpha-trehalose-phosphate synthase (UDP-forming) n=1 Tax=unclassified Sinorhizobium TaxID=2613772 RepID=UPI0024C33C3F|nr:MULTISPECIES: trehalose-6-phosphate synthase [unclassified Sinorhizobium]MDK1389923.1 trehalose-6-phosphate synthase [Sinorhizobium sp. 7-81]MDK1494454.1 trehalose-6-phosphate synthase [Sinorhizobium sp. 8-89]
MSRLIVVSNRVSLPDEHGSLPAGGMAIALSAALRRRHGLWMGWSGKVKADEEPAAFTRREVGGITYALIDLSQKDLDEYYYGFSNQVLWPIFHDRADLAEYSEARETAYYRVNKLFADQLELLLREDDVVWVHDYHLIPLAAELRRRHHKNRIGFFLHTSWPAADMLVTLPNYNTLLRGLSFYDLVGFHTKNDLSNFSECLRRQELRDINEDHCRTYANAFRCGVFPISIDAAGFASLAERDEDLRDSYCRLAGYDIVIGVDRLDYSKGIENRIIAFNRFLRSNKHRKRKTLLLQITPKSREKIPAYQAMQKDVAELVGRVDGELGTVGWVPVHYINQSLGQPELARLYRRARVGLVTPLRDGMNLVAKEYVAAQDPRDPGVLVLSRFAGAANELGEAILVNPYDPEDVAGAIETALDMPRDERITRWTAMMERLRKHNVYRWCDDFLSSLDPPRGLTASLDPASPVAG